MSTTPVKGSILTFLESFLPFSREGISGDVTEETIRDITENSAEEQEEIHMKHVQRCDAPLFIIIHMFKASSKQLNIF